MIVVASAGLNIPPELIAHCKIEETPNPIVIDGTPRDVRSIESLTALKRWLKTAKSPPHLLGSSAPEYVSLFNDLVKRTRAALVVTGTRKFLGTYDAAVAATRIVCSAHKGFEARVLDTGLIEIGAGLIAAYCGAAARTRADADLGAVFAAGQALSAESSQLTAPSTPNILQRLGLSDLLRGVAPGGNSRLPIIGMKDGEFRLVGMRENDPSSFNDLLANLLQRYPRGTALWVAVTFAEDRLPAEDLLAALRRSFDVRYAILRSMSMASHMYLGRHSLAVTAHPVDAMKLVVRLPEAR
jgi:fatty acid-binding protein DegV